MTYKKVITIIFLSALIIAGWFYAIGRAWAFIRINPAGSKIQISSLQKGLVGYWNLDSESYNPATKRFTDKSAFSNHGTSINAASFTTDHNGQANQAMTFNGTSDYIDAGNGASLNIGTSPTTFEFWIKTSTLGQPGDVTTIISNRNANSDGYNIVATLSVIEWYSPKTGAWFDASYNIHDGIWHHVVVVRNGTGSNNKVYVDGVSKTISGSSGNSLGDPASTLNTRFGMLQYATNERYLNGMLDEVRIYNRALSQAEITLLYNSYRPKISAGSLQKGLVLDMPMDSGYTKSATVLTDRTPYSNNGTAAGGVTIGSDYTTFDGSTGYVDAGNGASLNITNAITISAWVNFIDLSLYGTDASKIEGIVIKADEPSGAFITSSYYLTFDPRSAINRLSFTIVKNSTTSSSVYISAFNSLISINTWHYIVATYDINSMNIYLDGVLKATTVSPDYPIQYVAKTVKIGGGLTSRYFNGSIDEVRIYNRALSQAEITLLYDMGKGRH